MLFWLEYIIRGNHGTHELHRALEVKKKVQIRRRKRKFYDGVANFATSPVPLVATVGCAACGVY